MMDNWGGYGMGYGSVWGGMFMFIFAVIVLAAIVVGVMALFRRTSTTATMTSGKGSEANALEVLNQRYAKGEISKDEYQAIKKDIA